ncbi:hypothetical protein SGGMMB4_04477 [Sodalis glossinidius str. 'morsitans']|uniref:Uncharacterized protein n=1 Tax=Sodalis glossinidius (strain morsitans) TaxID=343509 RepID=A0A193QMH7_SODGM|nr:hypothetical protein SGGMMB4_01116 [Sodalis glossinidius str. 'morsitans']CRL46130.1 hypothetical protein SGGMMB4_04477 [Sodalis glossinidius str. 'morsitans']
MTEIIHSRQDGAPGRYRHPPSAIRQNLANLSI